MRRGEVLGLRWRDVDFDRGTVTIQQTLGVVHGRRIMNENPKNRSSNRTIPVAPEVMDALRSHKLRQNEQRLESAEWEDNGLVFSTYQGRPIGPRHLQRDFERWVKVAGVPRIRIHDQRHTHASIGLQEGASLKAMSERLGHAKTSTTLDIYAHVTAQQHQDVSDKIGAAFSRAR
jgi:integrase